MDQLLVVWQFLLDNRLNLLALAWFLICFKGYMYYARVQSYVTPCLASVLHMYRTEWMRRMMTRDNRIADTTAIANLERSVSFFASTTILVMAGILTVMSSTEQAINLIEDIPFALAATKQEWELKLLVMLMLFVFAFFKFTWSLRQYGFASVMVGSAPLPTEELSEREREAHAARVAKMTSMAANSFNLGLRSYYFSIAVLGWLVNPWLFMILSAVVVLVLYRREFSSSTLKTLMMSSELNNINLREKDNGTL
ncbi:DUF599 domain-containing protein [Nitrincola tapanii]|uniref:DUF599 family protein n=1 Tax=Nitrincola tapanii TaxID=1708751 RepID=A0A5A9W394_9GAMM|nr:DUF599 domain-containing protein [Nitrincola tapanii]KAA0875167.1 DUF599 family protein [Nitrincola tapanii]